MSNDTAALLHALYTAYREKRLADVMAHLDPDFRFVVHLPEAALPGGAKVRNLAETREILQHLIDTYDFVAYDPGPIIASAGRATVQPRIRFRDKKSGKLLETQLSHVWRFRDGKAAELEEHHDVPKILAFMKSVAETV
jgi:ketosteroid isomerase-like protein